MTKQGNTQSPGSVEGGAEITNECGVDAALEVLLVILEEPVGEKVRAACDAIGQILSSGSIDAAKVRVLADAEDVLDQVAGALEQLTETVCGEGA